MRLLYTLLYRLLLATAAAALPGAASAAITYNGAGTPADAIDGGALALTLPAHTTGDTLQCLTAQKSQGAGAVVSETASTGWIKVKRYNNTDKVILWAKTAESASETTPVFDSDDNTAARTVIGFCWGADGMEQDEASLLAHSSETTNTGVNVTTPALTITTDNTLVVVCGFAQDNWESADIPVLAGMAEIAEHERDVASVGLVCDYVIQTTAENIGASEFVDDGGSSSIGGFSIAVSLKPAVAAATWIVEPTVTAQDTDSFTLGYMPSVACTFKAVVCPQDSAAPDAAEVAAGTCDGGSGQLATASEAVTGADTTETGTIAVPVGDIYATCNNASGNAPLVTLADECVDAPAGKVYVGGCPGGLTSIHANSPFVIFNAQATPDVAVGDIPICDDDLSPNDLLDLTWTAAGLFSYPGGDPSKQSYGCTFYDRSAQAMHADSWLGYVQNVAPIAQVSSYSIALPLGQAMVPVDLCAQFSDPDDETLTCTSSDTGEGTGTDKRPAGTSQTDGVWSGTPTGDADTSGGWTETATDSAEDSASFVVLWSIVDEVEVPQCVGQLLDACVTLSGTAFLTLIAYPDCDASGLVAGTVTGQSLAAESTATFGDTLAVSVYYGGCPTYLGGISDALKFVQNVALPSVDYSTHFSFSGAGPFGSCSLQQLGSAVPITTAAATRVSAVTLAVADASGLAPGTWVKIAPSAYRRVRAVNWETDTVILEAAASWSSGAEVSVVAVAEAVIPGVGFTAGTCVLAGTPTTTATHQLVIIRAQNASGLSADSH